jgi:hypothetical protein
MTLDEFSRTFTLEEDLRAYERKYGVCLKPRILPQRRRACDDAWVLDWSDWVYAYEIWLRRRQQYQSMITSLKEHTSPQASSARH